MAFYLRALCVLFVMSLASCKQGVDERCQITADCEAGLICEESAGLDTVKVCKTESNTPADAPPMPMVDGAVVDAVTIDADTTDADPTDGPPAAAGAAITR